MKILFIAGFGPVVSDIEAARALYVQSLGLPLQEDDDHYFHTGSLEGSKHFALWPLAHAAESCFGAGTWPGNIPAPTAWIEFDVDDVESAGRELEAQGYKLLVSTRTEPWGQVVTRFLSPEGILTGLTYTPSMRGDSTDSVPPSR